MDYGAQSTIESSSSNGFNLNIKKIIGTSAKSSQQFATEGNTIAYTASGGVVVCTIDPISNEVLNQRFFCANVGTSKNDNLTENTLTETDRRDSFGYFKSDPIEINNNSPVKDLLDEEEPNLSSPSKLKEKIRSINCITISTNQTLLAIGETGYLPRILIFSLAANSSPYPVMIIYEHSFGIKELQFSPDSKYLCSLGLINDGFINVWKLDTTSCGLYLSNKCSNVINKMIWHENSIITVGVRFIKIWKFETHQENKQQILKGKNTLLGEFISLNFIDCCVLNDDEILLLTNTNQLILLKLQSDNSTLIALGNPIDEEINSIVVDYQGENVWCGIKNYQIRSISLNELKPGLNITKQKVNIPFMKDSQVSSIIRISNLSENYLIFLNDPEEIQFFNKQEAKVSHNLTSSLIKDINGVKRSFTNEYLVYSKTGMIKKLDPITLSCSENLIDFKIPHNEVIPNAMTAIEKFENHIVIGDKYGTLYILCSSQPHEIIYQVKAHSSTINDVIYFKFHQYELLCSISRDRMIQFFIKKDEWELLQTIPVHNGNLIKLIHHDNHIYVSSSDRSISVHQLILEEEEVRLRQKKIIALKSTPLEMKIYDSDLLVSTLEKTLFIYDIMSYEIKKQFKFHDSSGQSISSETFIKHESNLIIWSNDKSLRSFHYTTGRANGVAWGQSAPLLGILLINDEHEIVSVGNDGCLFLWDIIKNGYSTIPSMKEEELSQSLQVFTKVARKILPTISSPIKSNEKVLDKLINASTTTSSPPRLTSATLKRMEARSSSPTRPVSPSRPHSACPLSSPGKSTNIPSRSNTLSKLQSPLKSSPMLNNENRRNSSSTRRPMVPNSPTVSKPSTFSNISRASIPPSPIKSKLDPFSQVLIKLNELKKDITGLNQDEKNTVKNQLIDIIHIIDDKENNENEILEKYSDKLVNLFQEKLSLVSK